MDVFDVLRAVSKRKLELMLDIKRLVGQGYNGIQTPCRTVIPAVPTVPAVVPAGRD